MIIITGKRVYDFSEQYKKQEEYFDRFIEWLQKVWEPDSIRRASMDEEHGGLDLVVRTGGRDFAFEVKTEFRAATTGNLCFETVSYAKPGSRGRVGWGLKMEKTTDIVYIVPGPDDIYFFEPLTLQEWVLDSKNYPTLRPFVARNKGYVTLGVLMPIAKIRRLCCAKGNLNTMSVEGDKSYE